MMNSITDMQLGTVLEMLYMILEGCKDLDEAKKKIRNLTDGMSTET